MKFINNAMLLALTLAFSASFSSASDTDETRAAIEIVSAVQETISKLENGGFLRPNIEFEVSVDEYEAFLEENIKNKEKLIESLLVADKADPEAIRSSSVSLDIAPLFTLLALNQLRSDVSTAGKRSNYEVNKNKLALIKELPKMLDFYITVIVLGGSLYLLDNSDKTFLLSYNTQQKHPQEEDVPSLDSLMKDLFKDREQFDLLVKILKTSLENDKKELAKLKEAKNLANDL